MRRASASSASVSRIRLAAQGAIYTARGTGCRRRWAMVSADTMRCAGVYSRVLNCGGPTSRTFIYRRCSFSYFIYNASIIRVYAMEDLRHRHSRCLAAAARLLGPLYDLFRVFDAVQGLAGSPASVSGARQSRWYSCQAFQSD